MTPPRTRIAAIPNLCNMRGFAALPTEVLHQIIPYMQERNVPWYLQASTIVERSERRNVLRVLSQICRSLRATFLPLLWERIERSSFIAPSGDHRNYARKRVEVLSKQLLGQLRFVTGGRESYGWCVRIINVVIHSDFANAVLTRLARAMTLMPNLHTIQIIYSGPLYSYAIQPDQFQEAFTGLVFPSVKRAILPFQARRIFACFPEAIEVYSNQSYMPDFTRFLDNVVRHCHKIETFGWIERPIVLDAASKTGYVAQKLPNLRRVECYLTIFGINEITKLARLSKLERITLISHRYPPGHGNDVTIRLIEAAKKALARSNQRDKRLETRFWDESRTFYI